MLGEIVETLVNKEHAAGNYEIEFNASSLTSGIYIGVINVSSSKNINGLTKSLKMILIK